MTKSSLRVAFVLVVAGCAFAHDFWIRPSSFHPPLGEVMNLSLLVGDGFEGEPVLRNEKKIVSFSVIGPDGANKPAVGREDDAPAGRYRPTSAGLHLAGYRSRNAAVELDGPKFESYLHEEGLEAISALRAKRGETARPAKETYSRSAKALFLVGEGGPRSFDREFGFDLELIPEQDPYAAAPGEPFAVRLVFRKQPVAEALISALHLVDRQEGAKPLLVKTSARTDAKGRASLVLDRPGVWLVKTVHMVEAAPGSGFDFESTWGSLTFELPARSLTRAIAESRPATRGTASRGTVGGT